VERNLSDLAAQLAANERGVALLEELAERYGADEVTAMMRACETNAADAVRRRLKRLRSGSVDLELDSGRRIRLKVAIDAVKERIRFDFTGSSPQDPGNFNAPAAVVRAAILYALRVLVAEPIPLNAGFFEPVELTLPEDCFLNPRFPAAVVAGNVETSQAVVDAIFLALGEMAASQGTMNNLSFGDANLQYYETIAGGSGAGPDFSGCSAVQTHMTNSRLTDPEVLEDRFPVLLEEFSIRAGSGGVGRQAGGDGVLRRIRFHKPMLVSILSSNRQRAPRGLAGGDDGAPGFNRWLKRDGEIIPLDSCAEFTAEAGDAVEISTPGGGAYGAIDTNES
jgi:5-oxoprolinase (ATP-hydrolysing)